MVPSLVPTDSFMRPLERPHQIALWFGHEVHALVHCDDRLSSSGQCLPDLPNKKKARSKSAVVLSGTDSITQQLHEEKTFLNRHLTAVVSRFFFCSAAFDRMVQTVLVDRFGGRMRGARFAPSCGLLLSRRVKSEAHLQRRTSDPVYVLVREMLLLDDMFGTKTPTEVFLSMASRRSADNTVPVGRCSSNASLTIGTPSRTATSTSPPSRSGNPDICSIS